MAKKRTVYALTRDVVIPAGTRFAPAPVKTIRTPEHGEALIGLGRDATLSCIFHGPDAVAMGWAEEVDD